MNFFESLVRSGGNLSRWPRQVFWSNQGSSLLTIANERWWKMHDARWWTKLRHGLDSAALHLRPTSPWHKWRLWERREVHDCDDVNHDGEVMNGDFTATLTGQKKKRRETCQWPQSTIIAMANLQMKTTNSTSKLGINNSFYICIFLLLALYFVSWQHFYESCHHSE